MFRNILDCTSVFSPESVRSMLYHRKLGPRITSSGDFASEQ